MNADGYVSTGQGLLGYNMFAYCGGNPVNRKDTTECFWSSVCGFLQTAITETQSAIIEMAPAYAACGGAVVVDGPLPIGDAIASISVTALMIDAIGQGVYRATQAKSVAKEDEEARVVAKTQTLPSSTPIYRYGGTNPGNLIPTRNDALLNSGLSFSTVPKLGAAMTTIEAINSTGVLLAI